VEVGVGKEKVRAKGEEGETLGQVERGRIGFEPGRKIERARSDLVHNNIIRSLYEGKLLAALQARFDKSPFRAFTIRESSAQHMIIDGRSRTDTETFTRPARREGREGTNLASKGARAPFVCETLALMDCSKGTRDSRGRGAAAMFAI
jgi:hypothetical protein